MLFKRNVSKVFEGKYLSDTFPSQNITRKSTQTVLHRSPTLHSYALMVVSGGVDLEIKADIN
jgi:hypothetical protein